VQDATLAHWRSFETSTRLLCAELLVGVLDHPATH
jgi:hypothetical protein